MFLIKHKLHAGLPLWNSSLVRYFYRIDHLMGYFACTFLLPEQRGHIKVSISSTQCPGEGEVLLTTHVTVENAHGHDPTIKI